MANEEKKKRINMSIEATKPFNGNLIVRSARSAMVVPEQDLQDWINDMTTLVNSYFEFRQYGASGVALKDGQLQLTGSPDELAKMMQMRADAATKQPSLEKPPPTKKK